MPRNGAGVYNLVNNTWYPPVNGVLATSSDWQTFIADIGAALTQSVSSDGQTTMTGNLPMGNNKLTGLAQGSNNTDSASMANLYSLAGQAGGAGDRNLLVNGNGLWNQRVYVSGTATTVANQVTLDRWRVVVLGQSLAFGAASPDRTMTAPAGGVEQIIEAGWVEGGIYTLSWTGTATATVNGVAITNGGQTSSLAANTAVTIRFSGGTFTRAQFELGTFATPWQRRPPGTDLFLCQRDYSKSYALATAPSTAAANGRYVAAGNASGTMSATIYLPASMRSAPTVTLWDQNGNINSTISISAAGVATTRAATAINITERIFEVNTTTAGTDVIIAGHWAAATGF